MYCIGMTKEEILGGYPTLTPEGLEAALDFAASRCQDEEVDFLRERESKLVGIVIRPRTHEIIVSFCRYTPCALRYAECW